MPIPGEVTLALFLVAGILLMVYVYRRASRAIETEIGLAGARRTLWFIKNGVIGRPSADESELTYELRVTIECVRFGMKAIEQSAVPLDQVERTRFILQETLDSLETTKPDFATGFSIWVTRTTIGDRAPRAERGDLRPCSAGQVLRRLTRKCEKGWCRGD